MFSAKFNKDKMAMLQLKVTKELKEIIGEPALAREVGQMTVDRLKFQARTEKPFNIHGSLPLLKDETIAKRKYLAKHNKTHATFRASRSNLTITGAFIESLTYTVKGPGQIELFFEGTHPGYKGKNGPYKSQPVNNQDLFKWLTQKGFAVFDQSIQDNDILKARVRSIVQRYVRRGLKVRAG